MRTLLGLGLCVLGSPSLFTIVVCGLMAGGRPTSGEMLFCLLIMPAAIVGIPFVPLMATGLRLLS